MFFFFNDTATTEIYTLSLHDALPIYEEERDDVDGQRDGDDREEAGVLVVVAAAEQEPELEDHRRDRDRKSTRLNSSHANISYAVFCLKKKKDQVDTYQDREGDEQKKT